MRLAITADPEGLGRSSSLDPDEGDLLGRLRGGDEEAFACLVDRHHAAMVRLARGYVHSPAVAEEVAQDAWLGLLRGLDRFEGRSSLRTWLFRIVVNRAISTGLQERQHLPVADSELGDDSGRFSQDGWWVASPVHWADEAVERMVAPELAARVRQLVEELPPAQRRVVTLRDVEGLQAAVDLAAGESVTTLLVATAAADIGNLQPGAFGEFRRGARALGGGLEQPGAVTDVDHVGDHPAGVVAEDLSGEALDQAHVQ